MPRFWIWVLRRFQELTAGVIVRAQVQGLGGFRLGVVQEGGQMGQVNAVCCPVVLVIPWEPAGLLEQVADSGFESLLTGVDGHWYVPLWVGLPMSELWGSDWFYNPNRC